MYDVGEAFDNFIEWCAKNAFALGFVVGLTATLFIWAAF